VGFVLELVDRERQQPEIEAEGIRARASELPPSD